MSVENGNNQMRVTMWDDRIGVRAMLENREDVAELIGRLQLLVDYLWPMRVDDAAAFVDMRMVAAAYSSAEGARKAAAAGDAPGDEAAAGEPGPDDAARADANPEGAQMLAAADVRRMVASGKLSPDDVERVVAEQLSDDEFEKLSPALAEAVALRRAGMTAAEAALAIGVSEQTIWARSAKARERGVAVGGAQK